MCCHFHLNFYRFTVPNSTRSMTVARVFVVILRVLRVFSQHHDIDKCPVSLRWGDVRPAGDKAFLSLQVRLFT